MTEKNLYETVLAGIGRTSLPPPRPPRASAGVVPWRRSANGDIEVFWVRRSVTMSFMGGWYAFPGGGMAQADRNVSVGGAPRGLDEAPADGALPAAVLAGVDLEPPAPAGLLACAVRELFEELGLLLTEGVPLEIERLAPLRARLLAKAIDFEEAVADVGAKPDASRLVFAGRWLTPPLGPIRFDNRFFLLEWPPEAGEPEIDRNELESGEWIAPRAAVERWTQGEIITAPPILHIMEVLASDGPEAGLERLRNPLEANLGPHRKIEFRPGVLLFPMRTPTLPPAHTTNCYLVGTREAALIDPGSPFDDEIDWLIAAVDAVRERTGRTVTAIWLTHHHADHVGGVERIRGRLGVPVCAHRETAVLLAERGIEIDRVIDHEESLVLDGDPPFPLRALHTPGHAPGHLVFLDETHGSLIAGDLVSGSSMIVIDPPLGNMDLYLDSLSATLQRRPRTLFPGHGPTILDAAGKLQGYIDHRLWREERILSAWRSGAREPGEMLATVYDDVPEIAHPLCERQILAHLERLRSLGRLD